MKFQGPGQGWWVSCSLEAGFHRARPRGNPIGPRACRPRPETLVPLGLRAFSPCPGASFSLCLLSSQFSRCCQQNFSIASPTTVFPSPRTFLKSTTLVDLSLGVPLYSSCSNAYYVCLYHTCISVFVCLSLLYHSWHIVSYS